MNQLTSYAMDSSELSTSLFLVQYMKDCDPKQQPYALVPSSCCWQKHKSDELITRPVEHMSLKFPAEIRARERCSKRRVRIAVWKYHELI